MSIKASLTGIIGNIRHFSQTTNMIAINASIQASKLTSQERSGIGVLAIQIQDLSTRSMVELKELDVVLQDIILLSALINKTGSQRMLLMKALNAHMLFALEIEKTSLEKFKSNLVEIESSHLNTQGSLIAIEQVKNQFYELINAYQSEEHAVLLQRSELLIEAINALLAEFEKFAGK
jgi:hypothetical protein